MVLVRQVLLESLLLGFLGGLLGLAVAAWTAKLLATAVEGPALSLELNAPLLGFNFGLALAAAVLLGLAPALTPPQVSEVVRMDAFARSSASVPAMLPR